MRTQHKYIRYIKLAVHVHMESEVHRDKWQYIAIVNRFEEASK